MGVFPASRRSAGSIAACFSSSLSLSCVSFPLFSNASVTSLGKVVSAMSTAKGSSCGKEATTVSAAAASGVGDASKAVGVASGTGSEGAFESSGRFPRPTQSPTSSTINPAAPWNQKPPAKRKGSVSVVRKKVPSKGGNRRWSACRSSASHAPHNAAASPPSRAQSASPGFPPPREVRMIPGV